MKFLLLIISFCFLSCGDEPSRVYVTGHRHIFPESGDGATFQNEEWLIFVKRVNGTNFNFHSKERILSVDKESYYKLKVGDTLKNKY